MKYDKNNIWLIVSCLTYWAGNMDLKLWHVGLHHGNKFRLSLKFTSNCKSFFIKGILNKSLRGPLNIRPRSPCYHDTYKPELNYIHMYSFYLQNKNFLTSISFKKKCCINYMRLTSIFTTNFAMSDQLCSAMQCIVNFDTINLQLGVILSLTTSISPFNNFDVTHLQWYR